MKKIFNIILSFCLFFNLNANADSDYLDDQPIECYDLKDPLEKVNRKIFTFNSVLDYFILRPVARAYIIGVNDDVKQIVGNFTSNVSEPLSTVNYVLQADKENALNSMWKFLINTTLGFGGVTNVAGKFGINPTKQTFGSTLARYGASLGPYIVVPILGSTNLRDMWDLIAFDNMLNPVRVRYSKQSFILNTTSMVHGRAEIMPFTDHISKTSTDPYASIRSALHQRRQNTLKYPENYVCGIRPSK